jgi:copper chaperone
MSLELHVNGMSCGHCVAAITKALLALDSAAHVNVDLNGRKVLVESQNLTDEAVRAAVESEGYEVVSVAATNA